jgi:hypothetical protein
VLAAERLPEERRPDVERRDAVRAREDTVVAMSQR